MTRPPRPPSTRPLPPRERVTRTDGRLTHVVQKRGHLSYCFHGCCCGRTDRGFQAVPAQTYTAEWKRRKLRNHLHLTKAGCLGPCSLNNVAHLVIDGQHHWFHSVNDEWLVTRIFDYIEEALDDPFLPLPPELAEHAFSYYTWEGDYQKEGAKQALIHSISSTPQIPTQKHFILLSHADTDLLHLQTAAETLPPNFGKVTGMALGSIRDETHLRHLLNGVLGEADVILLRIHGAARSVSWLPLLLDHAREAGQHVLLVSGTGEQDPDFLRLSLAPPHALETACAYLLASGWQNMRECLLSVSDSLRLTAYGAAPPLPLPEHGVYHPELSDATLHDWERLRTGRPVVAILCYRAHVLSGHTDWLDMLIVALDEAGADALPLFTTSLKDTDHDGTPKIFAWLHGADAVISTLSFAMSDGAGDNEALVALGLPMVQGMLLSQSRRVWQGSGRGLNPLDTAMNVALPEFDGRIIGVPFAFKEGLGDEVRRLTADPERTERLARIALRLARLRHLPNSEKRIAILLTNSTAKAAQVGNAVGLDSAASLVHILQRLREEGYTVGDFPVNSDELMHTLLAGSHYDPLLPPPAEWHGISIPTSDYARWFEQLLPEERTRMRQQWGDPPGKAYLRDGHLLVAGLHLGNCFIALQPPRGYGMDEDAIYHTPDLVPTHQYHALYRWLTERPELGGFGADALIHLGKHGTLEWLPGKGVGLSAHCFPDQLLGDLPLFYPFVINDPGEGTQAKRRAHATIIDHLPPPLTRADTYGPLAELARLVDEYYQLELLDPSKLPLLQAQIWELIEQTNLGEDLPKLLERKHGDHTHEWDATETDDGIPLTLAEMNGADVAHLLEDLDGYLCELGAAQIRDGLHTLGQPPHDFPEMLRALTRLDNAEAGGIHRLVAEVLGMNYAELLEHAGKRLSFPEHWHALAGKPLLTAGDGLELVDELSLHLYQLLHERHYDPACLPEILALAGLPENPELQNTLSYAISLKEKLDRTTDELSHLMLGLAGGYVPAGASGAPSRGQAHILPTGRNFYSVDPRSMPSMAAWSVGQGLAAGVLERWRAEAADAEEAYPEQVSISVWGTSNMRTGGDDVAEILALLGVRPRWHPQSKRPEGLDLIPLTELGRPRIDVTVRISGFFRDAFPHLITLLSEAFEMVMHADEDPEQNYPRKHFLQDLERYEDDQTRAAFRIFGNPAGGYGTGILEMIHAGNWQGDADFAGSFIEWGGYAYTADAYGIDARNEFKHRLGGTQLVLHNQDNREHDLLDSDDYLQFFGGMIASVRHLSGQQPRGFFGDSSNPERPRVRDLVEETLRVYRSRVVNPKWLESIRRHGYKGGLEQAATVDYLFGFDATAGVAHDFMYEGVAQAYALDEENRIFLEKSNPWALTAMTGRLLEAEARGLWNAAPETKAALEELLLNLEALEEGDI